MMRCVLGMIFVALATGCSRQPERRVLTESEFADAFTQKLRSAAADISVEQQGPLELLVRGDGEQEHTVFLDNAYTEYGQSPEAIEAVLTRYAQSTLETIRATGNEDVDLDRIVPVIKDAAYPEGVKQSLIEAGHDPSKFNFYYETLNKHLLVLYAEDTEHNIRYLDHDDVQKLGLEPAALREKAVQNLRSILPDIQKHGDGGTLMLTAGGTYEASLLLIDEIWTPETLPIQGEIVVAVPSRDLLLVTGTKDAEGLARVRTLAEQTVREASYALTDQLFVRRGDTWLPWNAAAP